MSDTRLFDTPTKTTPHHGGVQQKYAFDNGFGASVIRHAYSYGGPEGFWEVAVLDSDGHLTYDTPITDDVIGWLTEDVVEELLVRIAALEAS